MAIKAGCGGSFVDGLCCRMVIEAKRVFDGCIFSAGNTTLALNAELPQGAKFLSARVVSCEFTPTSVCTENGSSVICGNVKTVFAVSYAYDGGTATAPATLSQCRELHLKLPEPGSLVPYSIEAAAYINVSGGTVVSREGLTVSGCFIQTFKAVAPVDILVPTYGYCKYPPCEDCRCDGIEQRLFPDLSGREAQ